MQNLHKIFLDKAHYLAKKNFGNTFPNPSVGCILVKEKKIIASGVTGKNGRPHAEEVVLKKAGSKAIDSTMYLTLEPCFHNSKQGSCVNQIIKSGIKKIYVAKIDEDKRTKGKSISFLKKNKIKTFVGLTSKKTENLNKFFFESIKNNRPYIKVKMAISKDEKIAWSDYSSKWISNVYSRNYAHKLRYQSQAILTTGKTIIKDNPRFTVREKNKIIKYLPIIIVDQFLKIPLSSNVLKNLSKRKVIIFTSVTGKKFHKLQSMGCKIFIIKKSMVINELDLKLMMKKILSLKINNLLVESGGIFFTKLLSNHLVDELHIFKAPFKIGQSGKQMIINQKIKDLKLKEITKKKFKKDVYNYFLMQR